MNLTDILSTVGVGLILIAYFLGVNKRIDMQSDTYNWLNFVGAILTGISCYMIHFIPMTVLEVIWAGVSLQGIWKNK